MSRAILTLVSLLVCAALFIPGILGCAAPKPSETLPLGKETIKIGWASALKIDYVKPQLEGVELAVEDINASGGVLGSKLKVVTADTDMSATGAVSATEKLFYNDKVDMICGGFSSEEATAMQEQAAKLRVVTLTEGSTLKLNETYLSDPEKYKYWFVVCPDEVDEATFIFDMFAVYVEQLKAIVGTPVRVALVTDKALWTEALDPMLKDMIAKNPDAEGVYFGKIGRDATDFTAELTQIKDAKAHLIFVASGFSAIIPFTLQYKKLQVPSLLTGGITIAMSPSDWIGALGFDGAAYTGCVGWGVQSIDARTTSMVTRYRARFGHDPTYTSSDGWLMVTAYAEALKAAKTLEANAVIKALENIEIPSEKSWGGALIFANHRSKFGNDPKTGQCGVYFEYKPDGTTVIIGPKEIANSQILVPDYMQNAWKSWK